MSKQDLQSKTAEHASAVLEEGWGSAVVLAVLDKDGRIAVSTEGGGEISRLGRLARILRRAASDIEDECHTRKDTFDSAAEKIRAGLEERGYACDNGLNAKGYSAIVKWARKRKRLNHGFGPADVVDCLETIAGVSLSREERKTLAEYGRQLDQQNEEEGPLSALADAMEGLVEALDE